MVEKGAPDWVQKLLPGKRIVSCSVDASGTHAVVEFNDNVGPSGVQKVTLNKPQIPEEVGAENINQSKIVKDAADQVNSKEVK